MGERVVKIVEKIRECTDTTTLKFRDAGCERAKPGQFIMVWVPDYGEIPLSLSYIGKESGITVKGVGRVTRALQDLDEGKIGIRGPYGNHFDIGFKKTLGIAGGIGIAPLISLRLDTLIMGARTGEEMPLRILKEIGMMGTKIRRITDDGSLGERGLATDLGLALAPDFELVVACGPEPMLYHLKENLSREFQFSLERLMKCGVGLCGSCAIDGYRVCADGPVFGAKLNGLCEFGRSKRSKSGRSIPLDERY